MKFLISIFILTLSITVNAKDLDAQDIYTKVVETQTALDEAIAITNRLNDGLIGTKTSSKKDSMVFWSSMEQWRNMNSAFLIYGVKRV